MLSRTTQEAIKVGLSVAIALTTALWLGWDKAYWSVITIFMVAATESYSHATRKARNRLLGTLFGTCYAFFLIGTFAQNQLLFLAFFTALLALCVFMGSHKSFGYAFTLCLAVCAIIACVGVFDSAKTFYIAVLRVQETILGIVVYSLVFRLVWPVKVEDNFFALVASVSSNLKQRYHLVVPSQQTAKSRNKQLQPLKRSILKDQTLQINKLNEILTLPLAASHRLEYEKSTWRVIVQGMAKLDFILSKLEQGDTSKRDSVTQGVKLVCDALSSPKSSNHQLKDWIAQKESWGVFRQRTDSAFALPFALRIKSTVKSLCIFLTCVALWIYVPMPGGFIFPLIAAIFSNVVTTLPDSAVKHVAIGTVLWSSVFLSQYIFIMPSLTEAWQLAGLYFINAFLIWTLCSKPQHALQKLIAGNLSVVLCMGALQLTPSFDIMGSLTMLTMVAICLAVIAFYTRLFSKA